MPTSRTICKRCVMDTSAPDIRFDEQGFCNYCTFSLSYMAAEKLDSSALDRARDTVLERIRADGKGKDYDCIVGVSGGLDSSYVLLKARECGLRPLAVHLDNSWNSELAVSNIERLVKGLDVDLFTHVIDWGEFKKLQIAFFRANVVDIEILTDHALQALLFRSARQHGLRYILAGTNTASEGMPLPRAWAHFKIDLPNILDIYRKFSDGKRLRTFPMMSLKRYIAYKYLDKIDWNSFLNFFEYRKEAASAELQNLGWKPYDKKHYESVFTRFYQGYILPRKFNVDKRRVHYSVLICSGQMSRADALADLENDSYRDRDLLESDRDFVLKKLDFTPEQFEAYLRAPVVPHERYASNEKYYWMLKRLQARVDSRTTPWADW